MSFMNKDAKIFNNQVKRKGKKFLNKTLRNRIQQQINMVKELYVMTKWGLFRQCKFGSMSKI